MLQAEAWRVSFMTPAAQRFTTHFFRRSVSGIVVALLAASLLLIGAGSAAALVLCEERSASGPVTVEIAADGAPIAYHLLVGCSHQHPQDGHEQPDDHHHHVHVELESGVTQDRASALPRSSAAVPDGDPLVPDPPALLGSARPD